MRCARALRVGLGTLPVPDSGALGSRREESRVLWPVGAKDLYAPLLKPVFNDKGTVTGFTYLYERRPDAPPLSLSLSMSKYKWHTCSEAWDAAYSPETDQILEVEIESVSMLVRIVELKDRISKTGQTLEVGFLASSDVDFSKKLEGKTFLVRLPQGKPGPRAAKTTLTADRFRLVNAKMIGDDKITWLDFDDGQALAKQLKGNKLLELAEGSITGGDSSAGGVPSPGAEPTAKRVKFGDDGKQRPRIDLVKMLGTDPRPHGVAKKQGIDSKSLINALKESSQLGSDDEEEEEEDNQQDLANHLAMASGLAGLMGKDSPIDIHTRHPGKLYKDWNADVSFKVTRKKTPVAAAWPYVQQKVKHDIKSARALRDLSTLALSIDHLTEFCQTLDAKLGPDWKTTFPESRALMKSLDVQVQRFKAIEYAEKRISSMTKDDKESAQNHWNVARHMELIPTEDDATAGDREIRQAQKAEELRNKLLKKQAAPK